LLKYDVKARIWAGASTIVRMHAYVMGLQGEANGNYFERRTKTRRIGYDYLFQGILYKIIMV